jgi:hypothetical protein
MRKTCHRWQDRPSTNETLLSLLDDSIVAIDTVLYLRLCFMFTHTVLGVGSKKYESPSNNN